MYDRPQLSTLVQRTAADMVARMSLDELRRSDALVIARVQAGIEHGLYGFVEYVMKQIFPSSADEENLVRHGQLRGVPRLAATYATGSVAVSGVAQRTLPATTVLQRGDGVQYSVTADCTLDANGNGVAAVTAMATGVASDADVNTPLIVVSPVAGIQSTTVVTAAGITGGTDIESLDAWAARIEARWRQAPHGGAVFDYVTWAKEVAGVTRAWEIPALFGLGTIGLLFVRDGDASLIPGATQVAAVQSYIDGKRPVTAQLTVMAPTPKPVAFVVSVTPGTAAVKAAVEQALRDLCAREAQPGGTLLISHIREAVSSATGETDNTVVSPVANITTNLTEMVTFGSITFQ